MKFVKIGNRIINIEIIAFIEKKEIKSELFNRIDYDYYLCFAGGANIELTFDEYRNLEQDLYKISYGNGEA